MIGSASFLSFKISNNSVSFISSYVIPLLAMLYFEYSIRHQSSQISPVSADEEEQSNTHGFGTSNTFLALLTVSTLNPQRLD